MKTIKARFVDDAAASELAVENDNPKVKKHGSAASGPGVEPWFDLPLSGKGVQAVPWRRKGLELRLSVSAGISGVECVFFTFRLPEEQVPDFEDISVYYMEKGGVWRQGCAIIGGSPGGLALPKANSDKMVGRGLRTEPSFPRMTQPWARREIKEIHLAYDDLRRNSLAQHLGCGFVSLFIRFDRINTNNLFLSIAQPPFMCALHDVRLLKKERKGAVPKRGADNGTLGKYSRNKKKYDEFVNKAFPAFINDLRSCAPEDVCSLLKKRVKGYKGRALIGLKDDPVETGVDREQTVIEQNPAGLDHHFILSFFTGTKVCRIGDVPGGRVKCCLEKSGLPQTEISQVDAGLRYCFKTFVTPALNGSGSVTNVRCQIKNSGHAGGRAGLTAVFTGVRRLWYRVNAPVLLDVRRNGRRVELANGNTLMLVPAGGSFRSGLENVLQYTFELKAGETRVLDFQILRDGVCSPVVKQMRERDDKIKLFKNYWQNIMRHGAEVRVPDPAFNQMWKNLLIQCMITAENSRMTYAAFPSHYHGSVFGIEEGWSMTALAAGGFGADALRYCENTYLTPAHLDKKNYHHQYRAGLALSYACELAALTGNTDWLTSHSAILKEQCKWILNACRKSMKSKHAAGNLHLGLLPEHVYGGDINKPAFSLYPNAVCWRGLRDYGLALQKSGAIPISETYLKEARAYRTRISSVIQQTMHRTARDEIFLSMKLYWDKPYPFSNTHYPLFLSCFLETGIMDLSGKVAGFIVNWLENHEKSLMGIPVLYPMRLDPIYGLGIALAKLRSGRIGSYLNSVEAYRMMCMDRSFLTFPETGDLCFRKKDTKWEVRSEDKTPDLWLNSSSPLTAGSAVMLLMLRYMLVMEEKNPDGELTGRILLAPAVPDKWMFDEKGVVVDKLPTALGNLGYSIRYDKKQKSIYYNITSVPERGCRAIGFRVSPAMAGQKVFITINKVTKQVKAVKTGVCWEKYRQPFAI